MENHRLTQLKNESRKGFKTSRIKPQNEKAIIIGNPIIRIFLSRRKWNTAICVHADGRQSNKPVDEVNEKLIELAPLFIPLKKQLFALTVKKS